MVDAAFASLGRELPNVHYIDTAWVFDKLCDGITCGPNVPGDESVAFFDDAHLSNAGSLYLGSFLNCWLRENAIL